MQYLREKGAYLLRALVGGAATGGLVMALANALAGEDRALHAATMLGLGRGAVLAALLGGLLAAFLAAGGRRRIVGLTGLGLGLGAGALVWYLGRPYLWALEVVLTGTFGPQAAIYTGWVALGLLLLVVRRVAEDGAALTEGLLAPGDDTAVEGGAPEGV